jgi:hypothetical protein
VTTAGVAASTNPRSGNANRQCGDLQGTLGEAPGWLGGTWSEWEKELSATALMAAAELWLRTKGKHGRAFIARRTVGRRFVCTKAIAKSWHGHDMGRYDREGVATCGPMADDGARDRHMGIRRVAPTKGPWASRTGNKGAAHGPLDTMGPWCACIVGKVGAARRDDVARGRMSRLFEIDLGRFKRVFLQIVQLECTLR